MVLFPETGVICLLLWEKVLVQRFIILEAFKQSYKVKLKILKLFWSSFGHFNLYNTSFAIRLLITSSQIRIFDF